MPEVKPEIETFAKIKVVGVGGSGGSAINRMIQSKIRGVEFIAMNTDLQALHYCLAPTKLQLGKTVTRGLGAGMDPEMGRRAAEESQNEIRDMLKGADMIFVTCGLGGGTGSGAAPVVAELARDAGALTVAVVTRPFTFEGASRKEIGDRAHDELIDKVDTIITIPNDRVLQIVDKKTSLLDAFDTIDDILRQGVQGISELITIKGDINVDFADVKTIMSHSGSALMGIGRATGENRAIEAAKAAIASPLLDVSIDGAKGVLFTIAGGTSMGMHEVNEAAKLITGTADPSARVIFGAVLDDSLKDEIKITVIATGFNSASTPSSFANMKAQPISPPRSSYSPPAPRPQPQKQEEKSSSKPFEIKTLEREKPKPAPVKAAVPADEEDLEIPAFIRRKLGN
ncbi:MAG: cell division protein FtsZ [bacterium]|nr:cell division protein FtsZ [bacterium]